MRPLILSLGVVAIAGVLQSCTEQRGPEAITAAPNFNETPPPCDKDCIAFGRMTGGGRDIAVGGAKVTKGLTIHCDIVLSNNLEINWDGGNNWHLNKPLTSAECIDDPAVDPAPPPAPFDTFIGVGEGSLNGVDGYIANFTFVDAGEPGGKNDMAAITITSPGGEVVLEVPLSETSTGNLQAHYDQPHGNHAPH